MPTTQIHLEWLRPLGNLTPAKISGPSSMLGEITSLTVTEQARIHFGPWPDCEEPLREFVEAFIYDDPPANQRIRKMIVRDLPEGELCIWTEPGLGSVHILRWEERFNVQPGDERG